MYWEVLLKQKLEINCFQLFSAIRAAKSIEDLSEIPFHPTIRHTKQLFIWRMFKDAISTA
jgi:hypothetical protein